MMNNSSSPIENVQSNNGVSKGGKCKALYDFQALNPGELDFKGFFDFEKLEKILGNLLWNVKGYI